MNSVPVSRPPFTPEDRELVRWQLKHLTEHAGDLTSSELLWVTRYDKEFKDLGRLSPRQMEVLQSIYEKH